MKILFFLLMLLPGALRAEMEILPLRHRTVEQVLPVLRPLVEPGGALSGMQNQLIIRASPANIADLKRVLASIDTPQRRLLISVRQDLEGAAASRDARVTGTVGSGGVVISNEPGPVSRERGVNVRIVESGMRRDERVDQQVQALEGSLAFISTGSLQPVPTRSVTRMPGGGVIVTDSVHYREVSTGFEVLPRVVGEEVFLDINPRRETPGAGGSVNVQRLSTSASGRLGEWFELGGLVQSAGAQGGGVLSSGDARRVENRRVWVKVEELH